MPLRGISTNISPVSPAFWTASMSSARWRAYSLASSMQRWISSSLAPSKTGVTAWKPRTAAAQPRWVSRIWPTFIRLGTPSGLSTMSTGVPSSRNGMSSSGTIRAMTPLLPWRPAILSPTLVRRLVATQTLTISSTPLGSSSPRFIWAVLRSFSSSISFIRGQYCLATSKAAARIAAGLTHLMRPSRIWALSFSICSRSTSTSSLWRPSGGCRGRP